MRYMFFPHSVWGLGAQRSWDSMYIFFVLQLDTYKKYYHIELLVIFWETTVLQVSPSMLKYWCSSVGSTTNIFWKLRSDAAQLENGLIEDLEWRRKAYGVELFDSARAKWQYIVLTKTISVILLSTLKSKFYLSTPSICNCCSLLWIRVSLLFPIFIF